MFQMDKWLKNGNVSGFSITPSHVTSGCSPADPSNASQTPSSHLVSQPASAPTPSPSGRRRVTDILMTLIAQMQEA